MNAKELNRQWKLIERARSRGCNPRTAEKFFVDECRRIGLYWADAEGMDVQGACLGVVHSILVMLDGCAVGAPAYAVRPINEDGVEGDDLAGHGLHHKLHFVRGKSPRRHPRQGEQGAKRTAAERIAAERDWRRAVARAYPEGSPVAPKTGGAS